LERRVDDDETDGDAKQANLGIVRCLDGDSKALDAEKLETTERSTAVLDSSRLPRRPAKSCVAELML
jgi:hypothetical protein